MNTYSTDGVMIQLFQTLSSDMKRCLQTTGDMAFTQSVFHARKHKLILHDSMDAYTYKWCTQISSLLKRYTFHSDIISPSEREELTNDKFIKLQASLAQVYWRPRSTRLHQVLRLARSHTRRILSGFTPTELHKYGRFGTKATVGCPANDAYIDQKLLSRPITGSALHKEWFTNNYLAGDPLLASMIKHRDVQIVAELSQVNVPKKYNIDRGINPNTLIGSLHSSALGRIVEEALRKEGLDIRRLQSRHANLMRYASIRWKETGYIPFATADLSNASHSFLSHVLNAMLPREWYRACMTGVIRQVEVGQRHYRLESIMTMGIGFTFPMQTLLFYCLLLSIQQLLQIKGRISVYGDDLIYPVKMHPYVAAIFEEMGFQFNLDKTFVQSPFRESCGSDWFKGVDVRPFSPEGRNELLGRTQYAAFCYKLINGLLLRWSEEEVCSSINLLKYCITHAMGKLFIVPSHFADTAGIKTSNPLYEIRRVNDDPHCRFKAVEVSWPFDEAMVPGFASYLAPQEEPSFQDHLFTHLTATNQRRYVVDHGPYYWDWLRSNQISGDPDSHPPRPVSQAIMVIASKGTPTFGWSRKRRKHEQHILVNGRKVHRRYAVVAQKDPEQVTRYEVKLAHVCSPHTEER